MSHLRTRGLLASVFLLGALAGCGAPPDDGVTEQHEEALSSSCGAQSDPSCVGLTLSAVCEGTGHCRRDPDYATACDCVVPAPPPPTSWCYCAGGTPIGSACPHGGTCHIVLGGQMAGCTC